jgi:hypothetical protein
LQHLLQNVETVCSHVSILTFKGLLTGVFANRTGCGFHGTSGFSGLGLCGFGGFTEMVLGATGNVAECSCYVGGTFLTFFQGLLSKA